MATQKDRDLDRITEMVPVVEKPGIYEVTYVPAIGKRAGEPVELVAPVIPLNDDDFIIERVILKRGGGTKTIPMLARLDLTGG